MAPKNTLHQEISRQTKSLHSKAHNTIYLGDLLKNKIETICYIAHLRAFAIVYGTLETQLSTCRDQTIKNLFAEYTPKLPKILADIESLKAHQFADITPAVNNALHAADKIIANKLLNPYKLLGYLYITEGMLNGGRILKPHIEKALSIENQKGTSYFSTSNMPFWNRLIDTLNTIENSEKKQAVTDGAKELFEQIIKIYESLYPYNEKDLRKHITSINPEAGNYSIPTDPNEIEAGIKAGIQCWDHFPYYEVRYADRGKRFAASDAVWLVTLAGLPECDVIQQINWLTSFLALRGMPFYTMETQLYILHKKLIMACKHKKEQYDVILCAANNLKTQRQKYISDKIFEKSNQILEKYLSENKVTNKICLQMKANMGKLIASSVADSKTGNPQYKTALKDWLTQAEIFPQNWIKSINECYNEIEASISM